MPDQTVTSDGQPPAVIPRSETVNDNKIKILLEDGNEYWMQITEVEE